MGESAFTPACEACESGVLRHLEHDFPVDVARSLRARCCARSQYRGIVAVPMHIRKTTSSGFVWALAFGEADERTVQFTAGDTLGAQFLGALKLFGDDGAKHDL